MEWSATRRMLVMPMGEAEPATSPASRTSSSVAKAQVVAVEVVLQLDLIHLQVAPHGDEHHLVVGGIKDGLQRPAGGHVKELGQPGYSLDARGIHLLQGLFRYGSLLGIQALGLFGVGGVAAAGTGDDRVLAGGGGQQELVGVLAADGAAVGLGHQHGQAAAAVDVAISQGHGLVTVVQAVVVGIETVGVLHVELAHPHQAGPGTGFIPELGLNLVENHRQVAVALDIGADDAGNHLLVGGGQHHGTAPAVLHGEQHLAHGLGPARLLPQFPGLQGGHHQLLAAGGVHLLADDVLDFAQGAPGQGQVGIDAGRHLVDEAGPQHEAVAGRFRLGRVLPQGLGHQLGESHIVVSLLLRGRGVPGVDYFDAAVGKVSHVAGGNGCAAGPGDGGDLAVQFVPFHGPAN